jgi:hypothetical protein
MFIPKDQKETIAKISGLICQVRNIADELQSELFESDLDDLAYFFKYDVQFELENIESAVDDKLESLNADDSQFINLGE